MENQEALALLREQLRAKDREFRKQEAEKARNDQRVKHVLSLSEKKIQDLKQVINEQTETIKYNQIAAQKRTESAKPDKGRETKEAPVAVKIETKIETKEVVVQDPKILKEVEELRNKNKELTEKAQAEEKERKKFEKEKSFMLKEFHKLRDTNTTKLEGLQKRVAEVQSLSIEAQTKIEQLAKEKDLLATEKEAMTSISKKLTDEKNLLVDRIKKIKDDPENADALKKKIVSLEKRIQDSLKSSEKLAKEKEDVIKSYEDLLQIEDNTGVKTKRLPSEIIAEMKNELAEAIREKKKVEEALDKERKAMKAKIAEERQKIEDEMKDKLAHIKVQKAKAATVGEVEEGAAEWLLTYADMATLLLTFFILMYAIAAENVSKVKTVLFGESRSGIGVMELLDAVEIKRTVAELTRKKSKDIVSEAKELAGTEMDATTDKSKVVFRVPGGTLFGPGDANLIKEARPVLDNIIKTIKKFPEYKINIQGHTDDTPISTDRFPTNWELSAARATAVLRYFIDKGIDPLKLTATGFADIFPLASNDAEFGRTKNRRVEFVLEKEGKR